MERIKVFIADRRIDHGDPARPSVRFGNGIERRAVVGAVAARLDNDIAGKAEMIAQRKKLFGASILGIVLGLGAEREIGFGSEDMAMRVDSAGRRHESRS